MKLPLPSSLRLPLLALLAPLTIAVGCGEIDTPSTAPLGGGDVLTPPSSAPHFPSFPGAGARATRRPFPQALTYPGTIKPNTTDQAGLNAAVQRSFDRWKSSFLKRSNGITPGGGYYVAMHPEGEDNDKITSSEAHGYGMLIFALMAGYDPDARSIFDGFYNMYDHHRSTQNRNNMSWVIGPSETVAEDDDSATDGDMDIAYALILADRQWGSTGTVDYLAEAKRIITQGLQVSNVGSGTYRMLLGDWSTSDPLGTRSSDWMFGHFTAFKGATDDVVWDRVAQATRLILTQLTNTYSGTTGLVPDFVTDQPPRPAPARFLEADTDGAYSWNACRVPWRLATDVAHNGSSESRAALEKMLTWIKGESRGDPAAIKAGYSLSGVALVSDSSTAYIAPFVAASIIGTSHQAFLNAGWAAIKDRREGYYADTITLMSMLLVSGNWWAPD